MTLTMNGECVRLVECPFCETDLADLRPADHLVQCEGFRQWGESR